MQVSTSDSLAPTISTQPASKTVSVGSSVTFSVVATGAAPLTYQWLRNGVNIGGATLASYTLATAALSDTGAQFQVRVANSNGSKLSAIAVLTVTANKPPSAEILTPTAGTTYFGGMVINYSGSGVDPEDGTLPASAFTWQIDFHHDTHLHPFLPATTGSKTGTVTIPDRGETSANVFYRLILTTKDSAGLVTTVYRDIVPQTSQMTFTTSPTGLQLSLDGVPLVAPQTVTGVVGIKRTIAAASPQIKDGLTDTFKSWSDGQPASHEISTPAANTTYTAAFAASSSFQRLASKVLSDPSCADIGNGEVICGVRGANNGFYAARYNNGVWSSFVSVPSAIIASPSCTAIAVGQAICGVTGTDNAFYAARYNGTWSSFVKVPSVITSDPSCTGIGGGQAICGVRGTDNGFYATHYDGAVWSSFTNVPAAIVSHPSCAGIGGGQAICGVRGADNGFYATLFNGAGWLPFKQVPGSIIYAPSCAAIGGGEVVCGVRGVDNGFYGTHYSGSWSSFTRVPGVLDLGPSCTGIGLAGQAICGVTGTNNGFYATRYNNGVWSSFVQVPGKIISSPSCTSLGAGTALCAAVGPDNAMFVTVGP
jgi:hypothetical protein